MMPLAEFVETYYRLHAVPNLAGSTPDFYKLTWVNHIMPRLGDYGVPRADAKTAGAVFREELERAGTGTLELDGCDNSEPVNHRVWSSVDRATRSRAREVRHPARRAGEPGLPTIRRATAPAAATSRAAAATRAARPSRAATRSTASSTETRLPQDGTHVRASPGRRYRVRDRRRLLLPRRLQSETVACADRREQAADPPRHVRHQGRSCGRSSGRRTRTPRT